MSGNSVSNKANLKTEFLGDYPDLPVDAPIGCPHIADVNTLDQEHLRSEMSIPDLVATVLLNYKPAALRAFLDLERPEVHLVYRPPSPSKQDICIQRTERIVKIGYLYQRQAGGWDELYKYRIDADATGNWTPIACQESDGQIETDPKKILEGVPRFAWTFLFLGLAGIGDPNVELEWFASLLHGRRM